MSLEMAIDLIELQVNYSIKIGGAGGVESVAFPFPSVYIDFSVLRTDRDQ